MRHKLTLRIKLCKEGQEALDNLLETHEGSVSELINKILIKAQEAQENDSELLNI